MIGACIGFSGTIPTPPGLWGIPAALTLGGIIAALAIIDTKELLIPDFLRRVPGGSAEGDAAGQLF